MPPFLPISRSPKFIGIILLVILTTLISTHTPLKIALAVSLSDSQTRKNEIEKIETDLSREKEKYLKFGRKEEGLLGQLSDLEKKIVDQKGLLGKLKEKIGQNKKALGLGQDKQEKLKQDLMAVESRLARRIVAFYKYAKRGYLQLLGSSNGLEQLRKRRKYLKVVQEEDQRLFQEMAGLQLQYNREISRMKEHLAAIAGMEKAERVRLQSIKKDMDQKVLLLMKIHSEKEFYETAVKELEFAAKNLKKTLLGLEKVEKKKEALPTASFSGFKAFKGKLPLPFKGRVARSKGPLGSGHVQNHKGIYIMGPAGGEVKAVFPGRVDFSGWLKGYGQIIVINHGSRFFTVSAHLLERVKSEGEMVEKGEIIGLLGQTGSMRGPRLYFLIRKGGTQLDPFKWLKVH